eukprot:6212541-Pleurochrysis_carterae.AAC.3
MLVIDCLGWNLVHRDYCLRRRQCPEAAATVLAVRAGSPRHGYERNAPSARQIHTCICVISKKPRDPTYTGRRETMVTTWAACKELPAPLVASAIVGVLSPLALQKEALPIAGDLIAAFTASLVVAPLTGIIDVAVTQGAAQGTLVTSGLMSGARDWLTRPLDLVQEPTFRLCWLVYFCTYVPANLVDVACVLYLKVSPVMPKLVITTACNMGVCMYKDSVLAKLYGKKDASATRPFPAVGYALFLVRDLLANGAGFVLPAMVAPRLSVWLGAHSLALMQLAIPVLINLVNTPFHFLALSLYSRPHARLSSHARVVASGYAGASASRMLKGLAGLGLGGVANTAIRTAIGSLRRG